MNKPNIADNAVRVCRVCRECGASYIPGPDEAQWCNDCRNSLPGDDSDAVYFIAPPSVMLSDSD